MDNKVTKKRINDHLEYDWYKYLIILVLGIVLFYFAFSQINRTRDYEDVNIFVSCYEADDNRFTDRVLEDMTRQNYENARYGEAVLREISFETQDPLGKEYSTLFQTHGMVSSDVLILGESLLESMGAGFLVLTDEILNDYILPGLTADGNPDGAALGINDLQYHYVKREDGTELRTGIKVSGFSNLPFKTDWRSVEQYKEQYSEVEENEQPDDEFYLVINTSSVNIGGFGKKAKKANRQTFYVVNRFIKYYRGRV